MTTIDRLEANGIPVTAMAGGGVVETKTVVHDVDQFRSLLDQGLGQQGRQAHYEALFSGIQPAATGRAAAAAGDDGAALSQRIAAHVIGNANLSGEDRAAIAPAFPLTAHVTAAPGPLTVNSRYDLSTPDGSVRIAAFTDVILEQGGYFVCEATPLTFTCQTLTRTGNSGGSAADFNILGKTGATPPTPPAPAAAGAPGECSSAGIAGPGGGPGTPGAAGTPEPPARRAAPARRACRRPSPSSRRSPPASSPSTRNPVPAGKAATAAKAGPASRAATVATASPVAAPETPADPVATAERAAPAARPATAATASTRPATS